MSSELLTTTGRGFLYGLGFAGLGRLACLRATCLRRWIGAKDSDDSPSTYSLELLACWSSAITLSKSAWLALESESSEITMGLSWVPKMLSTYVTSFDVVIPFIAAASGWSTLELRCLIS